MDRRTETETIAPEEEPAPLPAPLAVGELFAGRFLVRRELGRGGFAVVYEAFDEARGEPVALKLLRTDRLGRATRTRFEREAAIATELAHPHLVAVREAGSEGAIAWIAMELVDGESLGERARRGALPVGEVIRIAREALSGLAALHTSGLVHRDVKPSNLLLDADGTVKLADFGLARRFTADEARATTTAALVGTLDYLSPEQALGDELDGRSDLYSLGVVLFELLAGKPLHEGRSTLGTLLARLKDPVPDLSALRPEVPAWLAAWMDKLLARERDDRYASAGEALADLEQERAPHRPQRRRLRRRWSLAAAALLLLALATAAVGLARRPRFDRMLVDGPSSVRAIDQRGRTLWQREGPIATRNFLPVRTTPGGPLRIAAVLAEDSDHTYPASRTLSLLDPLTGAVRETEVFPSAETFGFPPELADRYGASLWVRDLDGDGADELLVTFVHHPFYPSYTALYEPRWQRSRILFLASGHHLPAAAADLDGDGRAEVLLAGFANRLGWQTGLAALRIEPWVADNRAEDPALPPGETPDRASRANTEAHNALLWYALGPVGSLAFDDPERVTVDPSSRRIALRLGTGERLELGFDGFPAGTGAPALPPAEREATRREAWQAVREAERLMTAGFPAEGAALGSRGVAAAETAGDPRLALWARRIEARCLARAGRPEESDPRFEALLTAGGEVEVAFEAGRSHLLAGDPRRAAGWFRRAFATGGEVGRSRNRYEILEGLLFSLVELGEIEDAEVELARIARGQIDMEKTIPIYRGFLRWWRGRAPEITEIEAQHRVLPHFLYWELEFRLAHGEEPRTLLANLPAIREAPAGTEALLLSLESELRARLGEREEALALARDAAARAAVDGERDLVVRVHRPLLARRLAALEAAAKV